MMIIDPYRFVVSGGFTVIGPDAFYVARSTSSGSTATHNLPMSSQVQENDIILLMCHTSAEALAAPSGYTALTAQNVGTAATSGSVGLYTFWKRAGASEGTISIADSGDHTISGLILIRGCVETGDPFDDEANDIEASLSTSVTYPSVTTTVDNALILMIAAHGIDTASPTISVASNSNLCRLTQDLDHQAVTGTGGGFAVTSGLKRQAGATGTATATTTSSLQARVTLALKPVVSDVPSFVGAGVLSESTGSIVPALPSGVVENDILILAVETANEPVAAPSGYTQFSSSPQGSGTAGGASSTSLQLFWKRAGVSESAPTVADSGDHTIGQIFAFGGCITTGDPIDAQAGRVDDPATTTVTFPSITTTGADRLVVFAASRSPDLAADRFSGFTGGSVARVSERADGGGVLGNGGGLVLLTAHKETAGATGTPTGTLATTSVQGVITFALKPA